MTHCRATNWKGVHKKTAWVHNKQSPKQVLFMLTPVTRSGCGTYGVLRHIGFSSNPRPHLIIVVCRGFWWGCAILIICPVIIQPVVNRSQVIILKVIFLKVICVCVGVQIVHCFRDNGGLRGNGIGLGDIFTDNICLLPSLSGVTQARRWGQGVVMVSNQGKEDIS